MAGADTSDSFTLSKYCSFNADEFTSITAVVVVVVVVAFVAQTAGPFSGAKRGRVFNFTRALVKLNQQAIASLTNNLPKKT